MAADGGIAAPSRGGFLFGEDEHPSYNEGDAQKQRQPGGADEARQDIAHEAAHGHEESIGNLGGHVAQVVALCPGGG